MEELVRIGTALEILPFLAFKYWWLWSFPVLIFLADTFWLLYVREKYRRTMPYTLIEIRVPREGKREPRAMEQIFMTIHSLRNSPSHPGDKYIDGEVTLWFSFEIVSFGGEIRLFMRIPEKHRNMIEASFYAHYPEVELRPATEDYVDRFPETFEELTAKGYKFFGNELLLAQPDVYPLRTYVDFEEIAEERQLDPISALFETIAKIRADESVMIQILVRPVDDAWKKAGEEFIAKEIKPKLSRMQTQTTEGAVMFTTPTPGEVDLLKAIERNLSKPGFDTVIRYLYVAPKNIWSSNFGQRGVYSAFNQYAAAHLNRFRHNYNAWTRTTMWIWPFIFPDRRAADRRRRIWRNYRIRYMPDESFAGKLAKFKFFHWGLAAEKMILNAEELATIFHLPHGIEVGPVIKKIEARKVGPPAGLAIYGGETDADLPGVAKK